MSATTKIETGFVHRFEPGTTAGALPLLLLHGTGGDENDLIQLGRAVSPGSALLSPRGKVLENGMPRFFRRVAEGVFDQEDLAFRTGELAQFIDSASAAYGIDTASLVALGFSNGANIAASLMLRKPEKLAGAVLIRAMVPFRPDPLPDLAGKPILLLSGVSDPIAPRTQAQELAAIFRSAGACVDLHFENAGHSLTNGDMQQASRWISTLRPVSR